MAIRMERMRLDPLPTYTLWLRHMIRFFRMRPMLLSTIAMPFLMFALLVWPMGESMKQASVFFGMNFLDFFMPGILGITLVMSGMMGGLRVIVDREFGFLKEILVTPVSRTSIVVGNSLGNITTGLIQGMVLVLISIPFGVHLRGIGEFWMAVPLMILTCASFIGFALSLGSRLQETEGFMSIMMLVQFPIMFLSGAFFPVDNLKTPVLRQLMLINPLTYSIDGLRTCLIGPTTVTSRVSIPSIPGLPLPPGTSIPITGSWNPAFPLWLDFVVPLAYAVVFLILGTYFFSKMEVD